MNNPEITIVIVNYNVRELLRTCLSSLYKFLPPDLAVEVIVVDNHSGDGSLEMLHRDFPQVICIANQFNAGFPAANNQAFRIAKGSYIFMLNPDTEFFDEAIAKMHQYMESHPEVSMIGPRLLNSDRSLQQSFWRFPTFFSFLLETLYLTKFLTRKRYSDKDILHPFEADSFSGAAIMFRRALLAAIGYLDEKLFWIEEIDYCYRAKKARFRLVYFPYAQIIHHVGQSAKKNYNIAICNQVVNKIKFFKKYHNTLQWLAVVLFSFIHAVAKLVVFTMLSPFKKTYYLKAKAYLYTIPRIFNPPVSMH